MTRSSEAAAHGADVDDLHRVEPPDAAEAPVARVGATGSSDEGPTSRLRRLANWQYLTALAATLAFAAVCLGFLLNTPTLLSPDEKYHVDRVIASEHGQIVVAPESLHVSSAGRGIEHTYVFTQLRSGQNTEADYPPIPRKLRPSLNALGGNYRKSEIDVSNYESQHPPLYYALMGGLVRLWPGADAMAADKFVLMVRTFNVLLLLALPLLFFASARRLFGDNAIAQSAAFLPLLVPGLARCAASVNNDNLAILIGALIVWLCIRVMTGDRSLRTAALAAVCCVAGSLTKATILFALPIVPLAYALQWWRTRRAPDRAVITTLVLGGIASSAWWVHNYIAYGKVQPDGWGSQRALAQGTPRGDVPIDYAGFVHEVRRLVPSRFWGALGVPEPPYLPGLMLNLLTLTLIVSCVVTVVVLRGRRPEMLLLIALPVSAQLMVVLQAFLHFRHYLTIPGLQGRYVYPGAFGLLVPIALVAVLLLGRRSRWAPLLMGGIGLLVSGWAVFISVEHTYLHTWERLRPSSVGRAFSTLAHWFPLAPAFTIALAVLGAAMTVTAIWLTVLASRTNQQVLDRRDVPLAGLTTPVATRLPLTTG